MYKQHLSKSSGQYQIQITTVSCEKTGTIDYTNGTQRFWSKKALIKSAEQDQKDVFQFKSNK